MILLLKRSENADFGFSIEWSGGTDGSLAEAAWNLLGPGPASNLTVLVRGDEDLRLAIIVDVVVMWGDADLLRAMKRMTDGGMIITYFAARHHPSGKMVPWYPILRGGTR